MARSVLQQAWYKVASASSGTDGLTLAFQMQPDLILLDGIMPGMDGLETTRELRAMESTQTTPIVMLTSKDDLESVKAAFAAGCSDFVVKPFNGTELLAKVKSLLEKF